MKLPIFRTVFGLISLLSVAKFSLCLTDRYIYAIDDTKGDSISEDESKEKLDDVADEPVQSGPLIDLLGTKLQSLEVDTESQSMVVREHMTNEVLAGKNVIGLYFSADWCGPCRQFTPELVSFYERMNKKRGRKDQFQIVWISRCRDANSHYQYFSHMPWLALPIEEASGQIGQLLGEKYGLKGIPSLVLIDELGQTITNDARNKMPADRTGIGFPWRSPFSQLYNVLLPRSLRMMIKLQVDRAKGKAINKRTFFVSKENKNKAHPEKKLKKSTISN